MTGGLLFVLSAACVAGGLWRTSGGGPVPPAFVPDPLLTAADRIEPAGTFSPSPEAGVLQPTHRYVALIPSGTLRADLEPCGCTSPPSGGISRAVPLIDRAFRETASSHKTLVIDVGDSLVDASNSLLRSHPALVRAKAAVVRKFFDRISLDFMGLGEEDLLLEEGASDCFPIASKLVASNVASATFPTSRAGIIPFGEKPVLFLSYVDETLFRRKGLTTRGFLWQEPEQALKEALARPDTPLLIVVALHSVDEEKAKRLIRGAGTAAPIVVIENVHLGTSGRDWVLMGDALRLTPLAFGRSVSVANLFLRREPTSRWRDLANLKGLSRAVDRIRKMLESASPVRRSDLESQLGTLEEQKLEELARLQECNAFEIRTTAITNDLEENSEVRSWIEEYRRQSQADSEVTEALPLRYVGAGRCGECHPVQEENWRTTRHARAFDSLSTRKEDRNLNCIICHSTGYGLPGGIRRIQDLEPYRNVQCEACHRPMEGLHPGGSPDGLGKATAATCLGCHTARQDPRFDFEKYLRAGTCLIRLAPGEERTPRGAGPSSPH